MRGKAFGSSDIGKVRTRNEDSFLVDTSQGLFIVADGLGGRKAGDAASKGAIEIISRFIKEQSKANSSVERTILRAYRTAALYVYQLAHSKPATQGAMTTLTALLLKGGRYYIVHVGDTRAYLLRGGHLRQLTVDDTQAQIFVKQGYLTPEQARTHKSRNILTKALGSRPNPKPGFYTGWVKKGDIFFLVSDGLYSHFTDDEMKLILSENPPRAAMEEFIRIANERGGDDNITGVIVSVEDPGGNFITRLVYSLDKIFVK
ncbi:MAG: protein phosphatase 2C domain-containing protein [candidate division WOR-3 bacterium]